jgi:excisionase family DNA binding protein
MSMQCLSLDQAAGYLSVQPSTLLKWARSGRIESVKLGRRRVFREAALEDFINGGIQPAVNKR